jgi:predicted RNA-binding protein YlqC (UPF0109 family)
MQQADTIVALIRGVVGSYILHHASLAVTTREAGGELFVSIDGHPGDLSRMIGKGGGNFRALETIAGMAGAKLGLRVKLCKLPPFNKADRDRYPQFTLNREWPREQLRKLAGELALACLATGAVIVDVEDISLSDSSFTIRVEPSAKDVWRFTVAVRSILASAGSKAGRVLHATVAANLKF